MNEKRDYFPKKAVREKLDDLLKDGQQMILEQDIPLSPEDISRLKGIFLKATGAMALRCIPFALAIYFFPDNEVVLIFCGALVLAFVIGIIMAFVQLTSSLRAGKKTLVKGIITDRFKRVKYGERDEDGKRSEKLLSYLKIGTREIEVNKAIYEKHRAGEGIELHFILSRHGKSFFLFDKKHQ